MKKSNLNPAIPQLPSGDIEKTASFFEAVLGFDIISKMVEHNFLSVQRGAAEIHFWKTPTEDKALMLGRESSCYIRVENIDALYKEFKNKRAPFKYELTKQPWGMNEMQVDDPFLNAIRFGEPIN